MSEKDRAQAVALIEEAGLQREPDDGRCDPSAVRWFDGFVASIAQALADARAEGYMEAAADATAQCRIHMDWCRVRERSLNGPLSEEYRHKKNTASYLRDQIAELLSPKKEGGR